MEGWNAREWEALEQGVGRRDQTIGTSEAATCRPMEPDVQPGAEWRQPGDTVQESRRLSREERGVRIGGQGWRWRGVWRIPFRRTTSITAFLRQWRVLLMESACSHVPAWSREPPAASICRYHKCRQDDNDRCNETEVRHAITSIIRTSE